VGGSGIGGTGITLVRGNVATVTASLPNFDRGGRVRMLALVAALVSREAIAQSGEVSGIQVSGGGKSDVTDDLGRFELVDVAPSSNFVMLLVLPDGQRIDLAIGAVPKKSAVEVRNIVINSSQGSAAPSSVEVRDNSGDDSVDDDSVDDDSTDDDTGSGGSDTDSADEEDDPEDQDSSDGA
jgi:hypothetical protein